MILNTSGTSILSGTPWRRHLVDGISLGGKRFLNASSAQGWTGIVEPTGMYALNRPTIPGAFSHTPPRSTWPPVLGAGAVRFGLPSAIRGIPGVGYVIHWATPAACNTGAGNAKHNNIRCCMSRLDIHASNVAAVPSFEL